MKKRIIFCLVALVLILAVGMIAWTAGEPIVATVVSIYVGLDALTFSKVVAAITVFAGVVVVSRSRKKELDK